MPWCEGCARFLNPNTLRTDGACPACGHKVAEPPDPPDAAEPAESQATASLPATAVDVPKAPWHFKLLVLATAVYLGWRFVELIAAVVT